MNLIQENASTKPAAQLGRKVIKGSEGTKQRLVVLPESLAIIHTLQGVVCV